MLGGFLEFLIMPSEKIFSSLILILILALAAAVYTEGFSSFPFMGGASGQASPEVLAEAKSKALDFIKKEMVAEGTEVEIKEIGEEGDLYKINLTVNGQDIESYMTKDLSLFFPSPQKMTAAAAGEVVSAEDQNPEQQEIPKSEKPEVQLFTMAFCPYGNQAEEVVAPIVELLGDAVEIEPHYIFYENYGGGGPDYCIDDESNYCSMHGVAELNQDLRELCVYNNQRARFWDFVSQVNEDCTVSDVETCWKEAASKVGVNAAQVGSCFTANSLSYSKSEKELTDKLEVTGSPTLTINGVKYQGPRASEDYKNAICSAFNNPPDLCARSLSSGSSSAPSGGCASE